VKSSTIALLAAGVAVLAFACSSSSSGGLSGDDGTNPAKNDDGGGSSSGNGFSSGDNTGFTSDSGNSLGTGTCQTGVYSGTFSCDFYMQPDAGIGNVPDSGGVGPITGTLSFMLTQDVKMSGELSTTDTASGTFMASTGFFIAAQADLTGSLDCSQGKFSGNLVNGIFGLSLGGGPPAPDPNNMFQGPLISNYDGTSSTFVDGQWSMYIMGYGSCIGTWTATYSGAGDAGAGGG
jgi:hypothetical protein